MQYYLLFSICSGLILYITGIQFSNYISNPKTRLLTAFFLFITVIPCLSFTFSFDFHWAIEFRAIPYIELFNGFWGLILGFLFIREKGFPNRISWIVYNGLYIFCLLFLLIKPFWYPVFDSFDPTRMNNKWKDNVCLQTTGYTCAPCSIATILKYYGIDKTQREISKEVHTSKHDGTKLWYTLRYLRDQGFTASHNSCKTIDELETPAIIIVQCGPPHAMVYFGKKDGLYLLGDPLKGYRKLNKKQYDYYYKFLNHGISVKQI